MGELEFCDEAFGKGRGGFEIGYIDSGIEQKMYRKMKFR